jgi:hypothetical protein
VPLGEGSEEPQEAKDISRERAARAVNFFFIGNLNAKRIALLLLKKSRAFKAQLCS